MGTLFCKEDLRGLSLILAFAMLLAGGPSFSAIGTVASSGRPEITNNICHPTQTFDRAPEANLARPAVELPQFTLHDFGTTIPSRAPRLVDFRIAPDTPPPKTAV